VAASVFFVGGLLLLCLGVLGEYIGRVYDEVRSRPLSIINMVHRSQGKFAPQFAMNAGQANGHGDHANGHWDQTNGHVDQSNGHVDQANGHRDSDATEAA
jgi:hypothetical protein